MKRKRKRKPTTSVIWSKWVWEEEGESAASSFWREWRALGVRAQPMIVWPRFANDSAKARPNPLLTPVIRTVRGLNLSPLSIFVPPKWWIDPIFLIRKDEIWKCFVVYVDKVVSSWAKRLCYDHVDRHCPSPSPTEVSWLGLRRLPEFHMNSLRGFINVPLSLIIS